MMRKESTKEEQNGRFNTKRDRSQRHRLMPSASSQDYSLNHYLKEK
jgi:predicted HicB family RNase H-like nuclease